MKKTCQISRFNRNLLLFQSKRLRNARLFTMTTIVATLTFFASHQSVGLANSPKTYPILVEGNTLQVEVANSRETRKIGLMGRPSIADNSGMLFVFPEDQHVSMWMKNTLVDLTAVFIDAHGSVVNIEHMHRKTLTSHQSRVPVRFVLEISSDSRLANEIAVGSFVDGLSRIPAAFD
jgi:uncharacterized membrane protein (UPF0127 family)